MRSATHIAAGLTAALVALAVSGGAFAGVCQGQAPPAHVTFRGPVLHVLDGEHVCVALGPDPTQWVPLRLADMPPSLQPGAGRQLLMAASFGQDVTCQVHEADAHGAVGICTVDGRSVASMLRSPAIIQAARSWR
jgi:hypothetical protein